MLKLNKLFFGTNYAKEVEIFVFQPHLLNAEVLAMNVETTRKSTKNNNTALLLGAGLAVTSMIILPAFAMRLGLGASLTGALRIALMKASSKAVQGQLIQDKANC